MGLDYYQDRNTKNLKKLKSLIKELPPYAEDFFIGQESRTSVLTRLNYAYDLRIFFDYVSKTILNKPIMEITLVQLDNIETFAFERFLSYLNEYEFNGKMNFCNESAKKRKLSTVRSFYKYFFMKDLIVKNPPAKILLPKLHEKEIIRLEKPEVVNILDEAENGYNLTPHMKIYHENTKVRDLALLSLFLGTGIRISELVGLNVDDIDFTTNAFIVTRKGGNRTILYFSDEVGATLYDYVTQRNSNKKIPTAEKALFVSLQNKRMSVRAVQNLVKKYAGIASPLKKITPHKLRSTFGTNLYRETGDIYLVADCLGHKDVNITKKYYASISEDNKKSVLTTVNLRKDEDDRKD